MISFTEALEKILALPFVPRTEVVPLLQSAGRIVAEEVRAPWPLPRFDNSSMDGFAVRAADVPGAVRLPVVGESAAGRAFDRPLLRGEAIRISTGAPVPAGADAVVPVERTRQDSETVEFSEPARPELYIRWRGSDIAEGSLLARPGTVIASTMLAFLSSFNLSTLKVFAKPRVAILTSGEEIRLHGQSLGEDQIIGSSLYYLLEELRHCACESRLFGIAADTPASFRAMFEEALAWCDIVVTTAGVSVGTHDVVGEVVRDLDGEIHFWKVAVRPGKPTLLASYGGKHHFGFPGNPVSTCCNVEIFLKPFLRRAFGMPPQAPTFQIPLADDCPSDAQRLFFVYARTEVVDGILHVGPLPNQNSGNLANAARADSLIIVPPGSALRKGDSVEVMMVKSGL